MTERILVPKTPSFTARVSSLSSAGIAFIRLTPSFSGSSPLSTFRKRDDASFFPQEGRDGLFPRLSVHGSFQKGWPREPWLR